MEELINSIPKQKSFGKDKNGKEMISGFCLRYRKDKKQWYAGYGSRLTDSRCVGANDPIEALADFVELLNRAKN